MTTGLFVGLMSGTSIDSVDAALLSISSDSFELISTASVQYPANLRQALLSLKSRPDTSLASFIELDHRVALAFAEAADKVVASGAKKASDITAIGSHGQTIFHLPESRYAGTLQLGDPSLIASRTGIDVIADFRRADMAAGGQGAPLAPAFHQFALGSNGSIVLNLGGIANVTVLGESTIGFDTGPANSILDECIQKHKSLAYDERGNWARTGNVDQALLNGMLQDPYFAATPPKSTGTHYFNLDWALKHCDQRQVRPHDLQRTLLELTAVSTADSIRRFNAAGDVFVCGGGLKNSFMIERLQHHLPNVAIRSLDEAGVSSEACECCTFAWLASQYTNGLPGNVPEVTGADRRVVLGGHYPGRL